MTLSKEATTQELATLFGIAPRTIGKLCDKNVLTRLRHGRFNLRESVRNYVKYREAVTAEKLEHGELGQARLALLQEKVKAARLDREERTGQLLPVDKVTSMGQSIVRVFTTALLSTGAALAPRLVNIKTAGEAATIVNQKHCEMLEIIQEAKCMAEKLADEQRSKR